MALIKNTQFDPTDRNSERFLTVSDDQITGDVDPTRKTFAAPTSEFIRGPVDFSVGGAFMDALKQDEVKSAFGQLPNNITDTLQNGEDVDVASTIDETVAQQDDETRPDISGVDSIAKLAGEAGLSVSAFLSLLGKRSKVSPEERIKLEEAAGISDLIEERFTTPSVDTTTQFNELFNATELPSVKKRIADLNKEISDRKRKFLKDKTSHVNNPWISQATRNGRIARERELANQELQILIDDKSADVDLFNQGLELIEDDISRFAKQSEADKKMTKEKLNFLIKQVGQEVKDIEAEREEESLRFVPEFLREKIKAKEGLDTSGVIPVRFSTTEENTIAGLGLADVFQPQFNRRFLSTITNAKERSEFVEDFKAVQLERDEAVDPGEFLREWLAAQKAAKESGISPELEAFLRG